MNQDKNYRELPESLGTLPIWTQLEIVTCMDVNVFITILKVVLLHHPNAGT